jgi:hypothetical protein
MTTSDINEEQTDETLEKRPGAGERVSKKEGLKRSQLGSSSPDALRSGRVHGRKGEASGLRVEGAGQGEGGVIALGLTAGWEGPSPA